MSQRHDISRQLIRIWVGEFEAGALDDDVQAADLLQEYEAKIAALERMVDRQASSGRFDSLLGVLAFELAVHSRGRTPGLSSAAVPRRSRVSELDQSCSQFVHATVCPVLNEWVTGIGLRK